GQTWDSLEQNMSISGLVFTIAPERVGNLGEKPDQQASNKPILSHDHAVDFRLDPLDGSKNFLLVNLVVLIHHVHTTLICQPIRNRRRPTEIRDRCLHTQLPS